MVVKNLGGRLIAKAFARRIIIGLDHVCKALIRERSQVGFAGQGPAEPADGVFDPALLPRRVSLTEEGLQAEGMEGMMLGEFRAVIEGDGLAPSGGQGGQQGGHGVGDGGGGLTGGAGGEEQAGVAFMEGQDRLAIEPKQHQIGLPVAGGASIRDGRWPLGQRAAQGDEGGGAAAFITSAAAFGFGPGQIVAPSILGVAGHLGIDEAVDGFVGEDRSVLLHRKTPGHLLGRPAVLESRQDRRAEPRVPVEFRALPAPRPGLLVGIARLVGLSAGGIAVQLSSNARWRAIQSCRDLAD